MIPSNALKPQRGLGQAVSRQRRKANDAIKRQQNSRIEAERRNARWILNQSKQESRQELISTARAKNLLSAVINSQKAVMASYGINMPVHSASYYDWTGKGSIRAWTDFESIHIHMPHGDALGIDASKEAILDYVATLRGVFQHELGHVRFTAPMQNRFSELRKRAERRCPNVPIDVRTAWNILEDQRMESAVVASVPRIASYFTKMVGVHILERPAEESNNAWLLVAGRKYLPASVRKHARQVFAGMHDETVADAWEQIVTNYNKATTQEDMEEQIILASIMLSQLRNVPDTDTEHQRQPEQGWGASPEDGATADSTPDQGDDDGDSTDAGDSTDDGDSAEGDAGDSTDDGDSTKSNDSTDSTEGDGTDVNDGGSQESDTDEGDQSAKGVSTNSLKDTLREAVNDAVKEMRADKANADVVKEANETGGGLLPWLPVLQTPMTPEQQSMAETVAVGMQNALNDYVTASQPVWMSHQEQGVIDPIAFRTKAVGDNAYRRGMDGDANTGLDLHVSLLCDASASMGVNGMAAISQVIYATTTACQRLGIGISNTLWSSSGDHYRVEGDQPVIYPMLGGTNPEVALDDCDDHNEEGAGQHLVIIFTDGDWDVHFPGLHQWERPNRHIVFVEYDKWKGINGYQANGRGADEAFLISNIADLPKEMTGVIANLLAK